MILPKFSKKGKKEPLTHFWNPTYVSFVIHSECACSNTVDPSYEKRNGYIAHFALSVLLRQAKCVVL